MGLKKKITLEERLERIERLLVATTLDTYNVQQIALILNVSEQHIYNLCSAKKIPHYKNGYTICFDKKEIDNWRKKQQMPTEEEIHRAAVTYTATHRNK